MKIFDFTYPCPKCGESTIFTYTPGRSAPPCSNPNSPAFSDSGDPDEVDGPYNCLECGTEFALDKVLAAGGEAFSDYMHSNPPVYPPEPPMEDYD